MNATSNNVTAPKTGPGALSKTLRWCRRNPITALGMAIVFVILIAGLLAPVIAPYDPYALNPADRMQPPSLTHLFGTGTFGEDIFSRVLYGARIDLGIGIGAVIVGILVGCPVGAFAGYFGGKLDEVLMRLMDIIAAFPGFILAMAIAGVLGPSIPNLIIAIAFVNVPVYARLMRARFLVIRSSVYAQAARGVGASRWRILYWHLLPNSLAPIFVQATLQFGWAILDAAGLSFIGLGVRLPMPEWGLMISLGVPQIISGQWWISFFPGLAIFITVMGFNLIGDGLQDLLDPKSR
ncbi:ABC transporter permease [Martelella alba]|uniref:ABC transporter permease n=1 Tax=Martelella alba TaxID=2590451 RepID=A0A506UF01_9HYPH|nr:ABC transporter permease [Martelella alba]TPW31574.1 ABC transporter permease [Martelella alba]